MQSRIQITGLLAVVALLSGCWKKSEQSQEAQQVGTAVVKLINVLEADYFNDAHIPGSLNISLDGLEEQSKDWDKNSEIVVYCANYRCSASASAARKLTSLGFTKVFAYEAGTAGWAQAGLPVEGPAQEAYLTQANEEVEHEGSERDVVEITTKELANLLGVQKAIN